MAPSVLAQPTSGPVAAPRSTGTWRPGPSAGNLAGRPVGCDHGTMTLLAEDEIAAALTGVPGWERAEDAITCVVTLRDFRAAMLYTGAVAYLAEAANHHPDIAIQWNKVTLDRKSTRLNSSHLV